MSKPKLSLPTSSRSYACLKVSVASNFVQDEVDKDNGLSENQTPRYKLETVFKFYCV